MPLTFKLSFELFDFNDEEILNDLKCVPTQLPTWHPASDAEYPASAPKNSLRVKMYRRCAIVL
jgi:hypothetical protein